MLKNLASWRTTAAGLVASAIAILGQIQNALDSDPATVFDWAIVASAAAMFVAFFTARDNKVTSEKAGAQ